MANRRQTRNQIRGPHSALTDFLASNNISAAQIHHDYQRRVRESERQQAQATVESATGNDDDDDVDDDDDYNDEADASETAEQKKRKRKESAAMQKIKQSKEFARRKARRTGEPDGDDDIIAREMMYEKTRPMPGQLENCEICSKRFTVTPYSKTGPNGGLLCAKCSKDLADKEKKSKPKKRGPRSGRRQNQSNLLDGVAHRGAQSLVEICIKKVADNINDIEEFGDLPSPLLHRLSQILSKRRALDSRTLNLFLRPDLDSINIYDCAKLETDDFQKIFAFMPGLEHVNLRFAGQMKDNVLEYIIDRDLNIAYLQLDATNLVSDGCWQLFFHKYGPRLKSLKLSNLDFSLDDGTVEEMCKACSGLERLKLEQCWKIGDRSLSAISTLSSLGHLSLGMVQEVNNDNLLGLIGNLGANLQTLSLEGFPAADDRLLEHIHNHCHLLSKLRFTGNTTCTDKGFVELFRDWTNPPLEYVDLSFTRDVDNSNPDGPTEPVGLASRGFIALMKHSGAKIQVLNVASCRHVSYAALEEVFSGDEKYPYLQELDVSFNTSIDDYLVKHILRSCPAIKKIVAFACFNIQDVQVPVGVALIGGLKAQDPIIVEREFQG